MSPARLVELARPFGVMVSDVSTVEQALDEGLDAAGEDALLLVTGSILLWRACVKHAKERENSKVMMKEDYWDLQDDDENFGEALHRRTEELYNVPDAVPDDNGLITCPVLPLRDLVVYPTWFPCVRGD